MIPMSVDDVSIRRADPAPLMLAEGALHVVTRSGVALLAHGCALRALLQIQRQRKLLEGPRSFFSLSFSFSGLCLSARVRRVPRQGAGGAEPDVADGALAAPQRRRG